MAIFINGTELEGPIYAPDGSEFTNAYAPDGSLVWQAVQLVDDWEHNSRSDYYWIQYPNQTSPEITTSPTFEGSYAWMHDWQAGYGISLPSDHPNYDSNKQPKTHDHYPGPGKAMKMRMYINDTQSNALIRIPYNPDDYSGSTTDFFRIEIDPRSSYWSLRDGSGVMQASDGTYAEDGSVSFPESSWRDIVLDLIDFPTMYAHIYDSSGTHVSELEAENNSHSEDGFGSWGNDYVHVTFDLFELVDRDDFTAASY